MTTTRSVCLLCRSFLLREQPSVACPPPPPRLAHTTREILQLSKLARSLQANGSKRDGDDAKEAASVETQQIVSSRLSKKALQRLPPCSFPGEIVNIKHSEAEEKYADEISQLLQNQVLGFDVECSPTNNRPILVQLASRELCVLWQVSRLAPFPLKLHGVLSSPHFLKVSLREST